MVNHPNRGKRRDMAAYEAIVYSHHSFWSWRIEDRDGRAVEDSAICYPSATRCVKDAATKRSEWNGKASIRPALSRL